MVASEKRVAQDHGERQIPRPDLAGVTDLQEIIDAGGQQHGVERQGDFFGEQQGETKAEDADDDFVQHVGNQVPRNDIVIMIVVRLVSIMSQHM